MRSKGLVRESTTAHRAIINLADRVARLEGLLAQWLAFDAEHENGIPEKHRRALVRSTRRAIGAKR